MVTVLHRTLLPCEFRDGSRVAIWLAVLSTAKYKALKGRYGRVILLAEVRRFGRRGFC